MRLYLSSFRVGDHAEHLLSMMRRKSRAAVIANAMDPYDSRGLEIEFEALAELGLQPEELDLRDYFDGIGEIADMLVQYDLIWVRGGNVFALRHALARSGADEALIPLLRDDALVYGGYSAGPCVLAPSLRGLEYCDDPAPVQRLYGGAGDLRRPRHHRVRIRPARGLTGSSGERGPGRGRRALPRRRCPAPSAPLTDRCW